MSFPQRILWSPFYLWCSWRFSLPIYSPPFLWRRHFLLTLLSPYVCRISNLLYLSVKIFHFLFAQYFPDRGEFITFFHLSSVVIPFPFLCSVSEKYILLINTKQFFNFFTKPARRVVKNTIKKRVQLLNVKII